MAARLVVLGLLVAGCQCWKLPVVNQGRRAQYYTQQNDGSYSYGFDTAEGLYQAQEGDDVNEVRGKFGADGGSVEYTAGVNGYVVTSLKEPSAPSTRTYVSKTPVRYATLEELATHPEQVEDTAEVKAAKATFRATYDALAAAAEAAPDTNIITGPAPAAPVHSVTYSAPAPQPVYLAPAPVAIKYSGPAAPLDASGKVDDTAEVKAAKASFKAAYDAAAAAAAAAPDVNIITGAVPVATYSAPAPAPVAIKYQGPGAPLDASGNVDDTAEVKAAKATFKATYDALAAAAEAAPDVNIITGPAPAAPIHSVTYSAPAPQQVYLAPAPVAIKYSGPAAPLDASGNVDDTAEVKAAKASFKAAYDAAAAAAAAAPDDDIITASSPVITYGGQQAAAAGFESTDGSYEFSYTTGDSSRYESADAALNVNGNFEFVADDAQRRRVDYKAGADTGFIASGAHLPASVQDTAEVASAKAAFRSAYHAAAAAAEAAPDTGIITGPAPAVAINAATYSAPATQPAYIAPAPVAIKYSGPAAPLDASGNVDDTAEVKAAKAAFRAAYDAAAAAAAAAPDTNIIMGGVPFVASNVATYSAPVAAPVAIKYSGPAAPLDASGNVDDTAEVKAAKASFKAAYDAAAAAAAAAPDVNIITGAVPVATYSAPAPAPVHSVTYSAPASHSTYLAPAPVAIKYSGPAAPLDASGNVDDTAEVKAAKAAFRAAYDAAAAAAAAAPDDDSITSSGQATSAGYSASSIPVVHSTYSASHGNMRTITFDGITLMVAEPYGSSKFGYSYE
ncbi:ice-structuring glycoprotein-like [Amphibalanus amphitrite]|uniref:ice-structuring glycoprotein-like n=1 Tax=Amphibalanus amphitrite TaxID=1232801 RepID=UPI001C90C6CF|nr:ice-structuring glycoprotein-like [Amphibalanus amphitrite]